MNVKDTLSKFGEYPLVISLEEFLKKLKINFNKEKSEFIKFIKISFFVFDNYIFKDNLEFEASKDKEKFIIDYINKIRSLSKEELSFIDIIQKHINDKIKEGHRSELRGISGEFRDMRNFNVTNRIWLSSNFETFHKLVGTGVLLYILEKVLLFYKNENNIYIQIVGKDISYIFNDVKLFKNSQKKGYSKHKTKFELQNRNKIVLNRNYIYYCNHSNKKVEFFRKGIFFNCKRKIILSKNNNKFNKNIIDTAINEVYNFIFKKFPVDKNTKIELKIWLEKTLINYSKMNIDKLFRKKCPLNDEYFKNIKEVNSFIKKENTFTEENEKKLSEHFTIFLKLYSDYNNINKALCTIIEKIFPKKLFGSNIKIIKEFIRRLISQKRYENILYEDILNSLDFSEFKWIKRNYNPLFKKDIHKYKKELIRLLIFFVFDELCLKFLRLNFYVTEKHKMHHKLFFYLKPVWHIISNLGIIYMKWSNLKEREIYAETPEEKKNIMKYILLDLPCAKLRFLPKNDSIRPIMTFYKKFLDPVTARFTRMGIYLKKTKIILRKLKNKISEGDLNFSVFDNYLIFKKLETFSENWKKKDKPKLYYFTMDIKKCYDFVNLTKMYENLKNETLIEDNYLVTSFIKILRNKKFYFNENKFKKLKLSNLYILKNRDCSLEIENVSDISKFFSDDLFLKDQTIFVDTSFKDFVSKDEIFERIELVCKSIIVKFNNKLYDLKKGLPQGLSISSILSSYYYHKLEVLYTRKLIEELKEKNELFLVMRLTDDYLVLGENKDSIKKFANTMIKCSKENDFEFNYDKFASNFPFKTKDINVNVEDENILVWIGKKIDLRTMEIEHNQIFNKEEAMNTCNINFSYNFEYPWELIKSKLKTFILNQNSFYFNIKINNLEQIKKNLRNIVTTSYFRIYKYFSKIFSKRFNCDNMKIYIISKKLNECFLDCSHLISSQIEMPEKEFEFYDIISESYINSLINDINCPEKKILHKNLLIIKEKLKKNQKINELKLLKVD